MTERERFERPSKMTREQAIKAVSDFASGILRWCETSGSGSLGDLSAGQLDVVIRFEGKFGAADSFFEGLRILGGHKSPRKRQARARVRRK